MMATMAAILDLQSAWYIFKMAAMAAILDFQLEQF